jgi:hypothetical protein
VLSTWKKYGFDRHPQANPMIQFWKSKENWGCSQAHATLARIPQINHLVGEPDGVLAKHHLAPGVESKLTSATLRVFPHLQAIVNHLRESFLATEKVCLMFKKSNWTARARRFLNRNWKFLVQSGITILSILHK